MRRIPLELMVGVLAEKQDILITAPEVIEIVCEHFNQSYETIAVKSRKGELRWPRQVCMYFMSKHTKLSLSKIGGYFMRDHSTALHAIKTVKNNSWADRNTRADLEVLDRRIREYKTTRPLHSLKTG